MLEFPKWFSETLPHLSCPNCKQSVKKGDIVGEGIRKCMSDETQTAFFIEYSCSKCEKSISMELNKMTLEEFTMELLDVFTEGVEELDDIPDMSNDFSDIEMDDMEEIEEYTSNQSSKMTQNEVETAKDMVREAASHYDFMMKIGLTDDLLEKYEKEYKVGGKKKKA